MERVEVLGGERAPVANDNDHPFGDGRWIGRDRPDDTERIVVRAPALRGEHKGPAGGGGRNPTTLAVIGDTPYGAAQVEGFASLIDRVNAEPKVRAVLHVGDIKTGSSVCSDAYFARIRGSFDAFRDPVVYTPGDNEWTDCHRASAGGYVPTERLAALRDVFFPAGGDLPGGGHLAVRTQAELGLPENAQWVESQVVFATVHAVGSSNGLAPWFGGAETAAQREERLAEVRSRLAAGLAWIDDTFDRAEARDAAGVVLAMQADMWTDTGAPRAGFEELSARIAERAAAFGRPVLVLQGDSHRYLVDQPLASAPNVTRLVVEGETIDEHLLLTVDPRADRLFSWTRVRNP